MSRLWRRIQKIIQVSTTAARAEIAANACRRAGPSSSPIVARTTTPTVTGSGGSYAIGFSVNVTSGSLGTLTCTFTPAPGGFVGAAGTPNAFTGWPGTGTGAASGDQREGWVFESAVNPVEGPILINFVGTMAGIAQATDLPMDIVFTASADASQRAFFMSGLGGSSATITPFA